jgi:hypothetical protein
MLRKADPKADRKAEHARIGAPESHLLWNNEDFDKWKGRCLAVAQPANFKAQLQQVKMPEIRKTVFVGHLVSALGEGMEYARSIAQRMNRHGALAGRFWSMDTLSEAALKDLMIALKKECRRRWPTKEHLLGEIHLARLGEEWDEAWVRSEVLKALCWTALPPLEKMYYEPLLVVLSVLRRLKTRAQEPAPAAADPDWAV